MLDSGTPWPAAPSGTVLSLVRTYPSGRRERWLLAAGEDGLAVRRWRMRRDGTYTERPLGHVADVAEAVGQHPALRDLPSAVINEYRVDPTALTPLALVGLLRTPGVSPMDPDSWADEIADRWQDDDAWLEDVLSGMPWTHRWASVNGQRVSAVRTASASPRLVPVLVSEEEEAVVGTLTFAGSAWHSEGGGAPISWDGGSRLVLLRAGWLLDRQWGDNGHETRIYPIPRGGLPRAVADWVVAHDLGVAAALTMQPLDPQRSLADAERQEWEELAAALTLTFYVDAPGAQVQATRRLLRRSSPRFRLTADALTSPRSTVGGQLLAALADAAETRAVGPLIWGQWDRASSATASDRPGTQPGLEGR